jgi:hypothetical protein
MKPIATMLSRFWYSVFHDRVPGLIDEKDPRNFGAHVIAGRVTRDDLTDEDFSTVLFDELIDQKNTDFCVGCGEAYAKEATEGMKMSWAGAFANTCRYMGSIPSWGMSILTMKKAAVQYGVPERGLWEYDGNRDRSADWTRMTQEVKDNAVRHADDSYFEVSPESGLDQFDTFRAYLNKFRTNKVVIQTGVDGHNVTLIGQEKVNGEMKLYGPDSYGNRSLKYRIGSSVNGYRYFSRWEANQLFTGYMSFDMPRSLAELLAKYDGKAVKLEAIPECYFISEGKRHLLKNEAVAWSYGTLLFGDDNVFVLTYDEMNLIPIGEAASFDGGKNAPIIRRLLEKTNRLELINEN